MKTRFEFVIHFHPRQTPDVNMATANWRKLNFIDQRNEQLYGSHNGILVPVRTMVSIGVAVKRTMYQLKPLKDEVPV